MGMLVRCMPEAAATKILDAYRSAGGVSVQAAEWLEVDRRTLNRWVEELDAKHKLKSKIEKIRTQAKKAATSVEVEPT